MSLGLLVVSEKREQTDTQTRFMCQSRAHFHEQLLAIFLGWLSKNGHKVVNNCLRLLYHTSF